MTRDHRPIAATCSFALRLPNGQFVADPDTKAITYSIDAAHLWLWSLDEGEAARADRVARIAQRYPWIGQAIPRRARP